MHLRQVSLASLLLVVSLFGYGVQTGEGQSLIQYRSEDGWTIYGTLFLPEKTPETTAAAAVLIAEPGSLVRSSYNGLAQDLSKRGMASLVIDVRGSGQSEGGKPFFRFDPEEEKKLQLDIRGAVQFLGSQKNVDARRISLVTAGIIANYAALEAGFNAQVQALVLLSGLMHSPADEVIKLRRDLPVFIAVDPKDRQSFKDMSEAYSLSGNEHTEFQLGIDHGTTMFSHTGGLEEHVADWLQKNVRNLGWESEISFKTEDGWTLHGRLWMPDDGKTGVRRPGVVFVHGAEHDQSTYYQLAREIAKAGIAALTFDWRGKNIDSSDGKPLFGVNMTNAERDKTYLDVKSAIQFLVSQNGIDENRIGLTAATRGILYAVQAASMDHRVKTLVTLSGYELDNESKQYIKNNNVPIFGVASSEDINFGAANLAAFTGQNIQMSGSKESQFLLFDNAGRGTEMLTTRPGLQAMIVRWFSEKLRSERAQK